MQTMAIETYSKLYFEAQNAIEAARAREHKPYNVQLFDIAFLAIDSNDLETLKLLDINNFNFFKYKINAGITEGKSTTMIHFATNDDYLPALQILLDVAESKNIDVMKIQNQHGHNIFQSAMHNGQHKACQLIAQKINQPDLLINGFIHKISDINFNNTLLTASPNKAILSKVSIKALLDLYGHSHNLDYKILNLSPQIEYDFSGISLKFCRIKSDDCSEGFLNFAGADLEGTNIFTTSGKITSEKVKLAGANIKDISGIFDIEYAKELHQHSKDVITIEENATFNQANIIPKDSDGLCTGITIEYIRSFMRKMAKLRDTADFDNKFLLKLNDISKESFHCRIKFYQYLFNKAFFLDGDILESTKDLNNFLSKHSTILTFGISIGDIHIVAVRTVKTPNNTLEFKIFDSNHGILNAKDISECFQILHTLLQQVNKSRINAKLKIYDIEDLILKLEFCKMNNTEYVKDSKNLHKLMCALEENNIAEIQKLSSIQKIDFYNNPQDNKNYPFNITNINVITYAISNFSKESILTLIQSNNKFDFNSKSNQHSIAKAILARSDFTSLTKEKIFLEIINKAKQLNQQDGANFFENLKFITFQDDIYESTSFQSTYSSIQKNIIEEIQSIPEKQNELIEPLITYQDPILI